MQEFSLAAEIVESVQAFARDHAHSKILDVGVQIGEFTDVDVEQLRSCYDTMTRQSELEGSQLDIEAVAAAVLCPVCSYKGKPVYWDDARAGTRRATLQCPNCGGAAEPVQGHECLITTVRVFDHEPPRPTSRQTTSRAS